MTIRPVGSVVKSFTPPTAEDAQNLAKIIHLLGPEQTNIQLGWVEVDQALKSFKSIESWKVKIEAFEVAIFSEKMSTPPLPLLFYNALPNDLQGSFKNELSKLRPRNEGFEHVQGGFAQYVVDGGMKNSDLAKQAIKSMRREYG